MLKFLKTGSLTVFFLFAFAASGTAQSLDLNKLIACFSDKQYPTCLFEMVEDKGFYRVDKQYFEYCDRVVYALKKDEKPVMFVNPMLCTRPVRSEIYPIRGKSELELQYQKSSRAQFDQLSAQIRKQCKAIVNENDTVSDQKSKASKRAYRHEASGITFVVVNTAPVSYIYLLK